MSDLHIPEAAQEEYFTCGCHDPRCTRVGYQPGALPLVVAAELRRLAAHAIARTAGLPVDVAAFGELRMHAAWLRVRADELDGGEPS